MPLGVLTDEEFELEKQKINGPKPEQKGIIVDINRGRGNKEEVPESARKLISEMAIEGNDISSIAQNFNVSPSSISAYKHGATSTASYNQPEVELTRHNNAVRDRIIRKARKKLVLAVDSITEDKINELDARGMASIAKDMSAVIKNMEPEIKEVNQNHQFIFYAPQVKQALDYPVIDVSE